MAKKTAVDEAAKRYWQDYFSSYGEMWVREIPRRIKAALVTKKLAAVSGEDDLDADIAPFGYTARSDGGVDLEGALRVADSPPRLFKASFDADGTVLELNVYKAGE